jgi:putative ATP-dependent endonuclease of the OLD family
LKNKIETFSGEESIIPNYIINLMHKMSSIEVLRLSERRKQIGKDEAERLLSLKVQRGGTEVLRNIQETVTALLGVQIDAFRGEKAAELDVDNFLVEVNGSGIREALRLLLDFEFKKPKIFLIEEPEVHLHPALETSVMQYLKRISSNCQVFITTHSTNFLDMGEIKNVYLISRSESTHIHTLDIGEAQIMIPKELGMRLSSLFMYDRLVFVEGPSDESIIREFASILGVNFGQSNVGFIHLRGIRNFVSYAAEETLDFLSKRQVKMWFIIDRDEKDDGEIKSLEEKLNGKATLVALRKREIENYLLSPRAIAELIKLKSLSSGQ